MLELTNVVNIAVMIVIVKLAQFARGREIARLQPNQARLGLIVGVFYDAQISIVFSIVTLALMLGQIVGAVGGFLFVAVCVALLTAGPRAARSAALAFSVPRPKRKTYNYHAAGTYRPEQVRRNRR